MLTAINNAIVINKNARKTYKFRILEAAFYQNLLE